MAQIPKNYIRLAGSERGPEPRAKRLGPAEELERFCVTISLRRRPDGERVPDFSYYLTTPPSERPRLSGDEFAAKYGAHPSDIEQVEAFARSQGLEVAETHASRRSIVVSGTVSQHQRAFGVELNRVERLTTRGPGHPAHIETYRGREGFIHIPKELEGIIVGVFGLDNRRITKRSAADPPGTATIPLPEITQIYDFPPNFAAGQTIAILSEDGYALADFHQFNTTLPPTFVVPDPTDITVRGPGNLGFDPYGETTQDITISATVARGASMAVYFTTFDQVGWIDLINRVVHPNVGDPVCSVLSTSFYVSNGDDAALLAAEGITTGWLNAFSAGLEDAAIQSVSFCTVSGDYGVDTSSYGGSPSDGLQHVVYPGSDPWALCCGGTTIGVVGATVNEWVWNDTAFGQEWATGGGVSDFFNFLPSYQVNAGIPVSIKDGHVGRGVPDVAANASVNSGYQIIYNGAPSVGDGTSAAAPLWAGLIAVINAALGVNVGFVNPVLYALGTSVFRDIAAPPGPLTNGINGVAGYPAGVGWDACTGWGTPKGNALLHGLRRFYGASIAVNLQDNLHFGTVCRGPKYLTLRVFNVGDKDLMILSVKRFGSADFKVLHHPHTPLAVQPGDQIDFTIEYNPTLRGLAETAMIQIISSDPVRPKLDLIATGFGGTGALETIIPDSGSFGNCCIGSFVDEDLVLNNNGPCTLSIQNITSTSPDFLTPQVSSYPLVVASGMSIGIPIRFQPKSFGAKAGMIVVHSDDPAGPKSVHVSGDAPFGKLVVTGSTCFGQVKACCSAERTLSICNVGDCKLNVSSVAFKHKSKHWKLVNNPFPATLHPGSCLAVLIRYLATEKFPRACELIITSNDPVAPVKVLDMLAATDWCECGDPCGKPHPESCSCRKCCCDPDPCDDGE